MRVLHVTPSIARSYGGPTYSLIAYSRAAIDSGSDVTIAAPLSNHRDGDWFSRALPEADQQLFACIGKGAFTAAPALHRWLGRNGSRFDVVHVHGLFNPISSLSSRKCVRAGWPVVIRPFGTLSRYSQEHRRSLLKSMYFRAIEETNLRRASVVHFTTTDERDESGWRKIDWGAHAFVVPPPWCSESADTPPAVGSGGSVLLIARLNPIKHIELLIDAWPLVQASVSGAQLSIAGDGDQSYARKLQSRAASLGSSVRFLGFADDADKARLLKEADLFVLPSFHENFGIAVLEALAAGLPVVLSPEVQLSSFVREYGLGVIAERSPEALAAAVVAALGDDELRNRCRKQGPELVARYFSTRAIGERLLQMYDFAIANPPS